MKIGLLLPSAIMYGPRHKGKVFAPKDLFFHLARGLSSRGHRVRIYCPSEELPSMDVIQGSMSLITSELLEMRLRYVSEEKRRVLGQRQAQIEYELDITSEAFKDLREGRVDIIHSFLEFAAHYFAKVSGGLCVYTIHDPLPDKKYLDFWRYQRFPRDKYIAISAFQASAMRSLVDIIAVVHHGLSLEEYPFELKNADYALCIGRYMPEKGIEDAMRAAIGTKTPLILGGSLEYRQTEYFAKVIKPYISNPFITLGGFFEGKRKTKLLGNAFTFLFPIHWDEPFGMVMIESMACGTPVIAYARGSVPEIVEDGVTGFIINESDDDIRGDWRVKKTGIDGMYEAINRLKSMPKEEYEAMRRNCRKHVEEYFTVDKMVEGYEQVYKSVLQSV